MASGGAMGARWSGARRTGAVELEGCGSLQNFTFFILLVIKLRKENDFQASGSENRIRCPSFR
jgi:hypothetical protein